MPIVAHNDLPTFERLRSEGQTIIEPDRALHQTIRELHIGLLNMMPDAALEVTERQFMTLVGNCNQIAQFYVHPFTIPGLPRRPETQAYIDSHYTTFEQLRADGLDALIITGAPIASRSSSNIKEGSVAVIIKTLIDRCLANHLSETMIWAKVCVS